ncbi:levansucrase [Streptomyces adelaidensis]|jgi:hypothetical protein|uniref:levansucrase n=1 Tax=Streptomyces adelaidensis TaxID=2796465 RepID=UPI0019085204|nr:levansucrase [Streptomyces adelaidensis]
MHPQQSASQDYLASVAARLAADECRTWWEDWAGVPVLVGRRADFKWRWMGTRLHLFTVAAAVQEITIPTIEAFTDQVMAYAKKTKGGLPAGFQNGLASFPVLISDRVDPAAVRWAEAQQRQKWASLSRPVVVDSTQQYVGTYHGTPVIGLAYSSYFEQKARQYFYG